MWRHLQSTPGKMIKMFHIKNVSIVFTFDSMFCSLSKNYENFRKFFGWSIQQSPSQVQVDSISVFGYKWVQIKHKKTLLKYTTNSYVVILTTTTTQDNWCIQRRTLVSFTYHHNSEAKSREEDCNLLKKRKMSENFQLYFTTYKLSVL